MTYLGHSQGPRLSEIMMRLGSSYFNLAAEQWAREVELEKEGEPSTSPLYTSPLVSPISIDTEGNPFITLARWGELPWQGNEHSPERWITLSRRDPPLEKGEVATVQSTDFLKRPLTAVLQRYDFSLEEKLTLLRYDDLYLNSLVEEPIWMDKSYYQHHQRREKDPRGVVISSEELKLLLSYRGKRIALRIDSDAYCIGMIETSAASTKIPSRSEEMDFRITGIIEDDRMILTKIGDRLVKRKSFQLPSVFHRYFIAALDYNDQRLITLFPHLDPNIDEPFDRIAKAWETLTVRKAVASDSQLSAGAEGKQYNRRLEDSICYVRKSLEDYIGREISIDLVYADYEFLNAGEKIRSSHSYTCQHSNCILKAVKSQEIVIDGGTMMIEQDPDTRSEKGQKVYLPIASEKVRYADLSVFPQPIIEASYSIKMISKIVVDGKIILQRTLEDNMPDAIREKYRTYQSYSLPAMD